MSIWLGIPVTVGSTVPLEQWTSGIEPMAPAAPALAGGFSTTEPPGKTQSHR